MSSVVPPAADGALVPAVASPPTAFSFSFDSFMNNFNEWSTSPAAVEDPVALPATASSTLQEHQRSTEGGVAERDDSGGFGFLFGFGGTNGGDVGGGEAVSSVDGAEGDRNFFFAPHHTAADASAAETEEDPLTFDFASFFANQEALRPTEEASVQTRNVAECGDQTATDARLPRSPLPPLPRTADKEHVRRSDCAAPPFEPDGLSVRFTKEAQTVPKGTPSLDVGSPLPTTSSSPFHATAGCPKSRTSACAVDGASEGKGVAVSSPNTCVKKSMTPPFAELSLSAALAAASSMPGCRYPRLGRVPCANTKPAAAESDVEEGSEDEEHHRYCNDGDEEEEAGPSLHFLGVVREDGERRAHDTEDNAENEDATTVQNTCNGSDAVTGSEENVSQEAVNAAVGNATAEPRLTSAAEVTVSKGANPLRGPHGTQGDSRMKSTRLPRHTEQKGGGVRGAVDEDGGCGSFSAAVPDTALANLIADARRACVRAAEVEAASRLLLPSSPSFHRPRSWRQAGVVAARPPPSSTNGELTEGVRGINGASTSDAVFFADVAQLLKQAARLSDETAKSAALFQAQTGDLLRLLGPHAGLAGLVGEGYAATPVVHLAPFLISLLENLLKDDSDTEVEEAEWAKDGPSMLKSICRETPSRQRDGGDSCRREDAV
jgi:hypothetical protein